MGAWGYRVFEDDVALDLADDWMEVDAPEKAMAQALAEAMASQELEYEAGQAIIVVTAIMDYALAGTEPDDDADMDGFQTWVESLSHKQLHSLLPLALPALEKLLGTHSELEDLWRGNVALHASWRAQFIQRHQRLAHLLQES